MTKASLAALTTTLVGCMLFDEPEYNDGHSYPDLGPNYGTDDPYGTGQLPEGPFKPNFGKTVRQTVPPPALSGGTLLALSDDRMFAADPDRDRAYVVALKKTK